jgi:putative transcriptional regulator
MSAHHPDDMVLLDYAAGSLSLPYALAISVHLCFCSHCRNQLKKLNSIGGVLLENTKPASLEDDAFDQLMAQLESDDTKGKTAAAVKESPSLEAKKDITNPLLAYLPAPLQNLPWQQQTREISKYDLTSIINVRGFQVALQKIAAGAKVPVHTHKGHELTVILHGGFSDELGVYHAGDFIARDGSHKHSPTALQNEDCICLTILDAPIKFTGWQRIFNPFMAWH